MMNSLTIGKIRGLQQITDGSGIFNICALDHRGSLKTLLEKCRGTNVSYEDIVEFKLEICEALTPYMSGILLDPIYGAPRSVSDSILSGRKGLLVSIEATGYENTAKGRLTTLLDDWGVEKIKRMGASAVKLLAYFRPDLTEIAEKQLATIKRVAEECIRFDISCLVEPLTYPVETEGTKDYFSHKKAKLVIESAKLITSLPIDVLKAEFPTDITHVTDSSKLLGFCQKLNDASRVPWVLLSAGVSYELFLKQVEYACKAGASGFVGGRAIWQESARIKDKAERLKYLKKTAADRFKRLIEITAKYGVPWYQKLGLGAHSLSSATENWYREY